VDFSQKSTFFYYNRAVEKIQFLYIEECTNTESTWKRLLECVEILGIKIQPERIEIHDDLEADHYSFQGSPSIKVDGTDLWIEEADAYHMGYRVYSTPAGLLDSPTTSMLLARLRVLL
jgi:hypothetical protein